ncbi:hypothetical protein PoB_000833200 [Plakobranchus ocellatus]|uniref:Uncharacterized protein n=1 Tax=Plakobranchus ocellatus TaxID=259542 RepID=A0AAV3YG42_9GAST|nr:hypothetical protein PoB_000833200 [Plakobranchus ocellatus]
MVVMVMIVAIVLVMLVLVVMVNTEIVISMIIEVVVTIAIYGGDSNSGKCIGDHAGDNYSGDDDSGSGKNSNFNGNANDDCNGGDLWWLRISRYVRETCCTGLPLEENPSAGRFKEYEINKKARPIYPASGELTQVPAKGTGGMLVLNEILKSHMQDAREKARKTPAEENCHRLRTNLKLAFFLRGNESRTPSGLLSLSLLQEQEVIIMVRGVGGSVNSKSVLRSAWILLSRVRASPPVVEGLEA